VGKLHPEEVKLTHWFPAIFTMGCLALFVLFLTDGLLLVVALSFVSLYMLLIFLDCLRVSRHPAVAALAIFSALLQLWGYGLGFLTERFRGKKD
jgi:hypothetical protein